jgi:hypothetical protein
MSRKAWFLGLAMSLAFAPEVLADTIVNFTNSTSGSGSNALGELLTNAPLSSNGSGVITGGGIDTFIPFSVFFSGNTLTGNSLTSASLTLNSGGTASSRDAIVSVSPVQASGCGIFGTDPCSFSPSQFFVNGSLRTNFTSIQSGARTLVLAGGGPPNGLFDLFALGFGPDLLAGNGVLVTGLADLHLDSQGIIDNGFNAITQHEFITEGTFFGGGTLTEDFTPTPISTPEPSSLSLLCTGLLAGLATAVRKRV